MKKKLEEITVLLNGFQSIRSRDKKFALVIYKNAKYLSKILDEEGLTKLHIKIESIKEQIKFAQNNNSHNPESQEIIKSLFENMNSYKEKYLELSKKEVEVNLTKISFNDLPQDDICHNDIYFCELFIEVEDE